MSSSGRLVWMYDDRDDWITVIGTPNIRAYLTIKAVPDNVTAKLIAVPAVTQMACGWNESCYMTEQP